MFPIHVSCAYYFSVMSVLLEECRKRFVTTLACTMRVNVVFDFRQEKLSVYITFDIWIWLPV